MDFPQFENQADIPQRIKEFVEFANIYLLNRDPYQANITVRYSVTDDQNAVDTGSFSINLTGTNDAPEATYTTDLSVLEGATDSSGNTLNLTGQLTAPTSIPMRLA